MQPPAPAPSTCSPPARSATHSAARSPVWAEVDVAAYLHNLRALRRECGVPLLCVLKADGYGHGAALLSRAVESLPPSTAAMAGVARVDEGAALRAAGLRRPILLLSALLPEEVPAALDAGLTPTLFTTELARALQQEAERRGHVVDIHLKIDTGMRRLGVPWPQASSLIRELKSFDRLRIAGIYTHFASADSDAPFTERQRRHFLRALGRCEIDWGDGRPLLHASNSAGAMLFPHARFDMVRPGIASYGLSCGAPQSRAHPLGLRPVMSLRARITHLKEVPRGAAVSYGGVWRAPRRSAIATVAAGYADGFPRAAGPRAQVLVGGRRAKVVGRVTMDQILVDVSEVEAKVGDVATLWGRDGAEEITADEVAGWAGTIGYEIVCGVAPRVPRVALGAEAAVDAEGRRG